ncbi:MAG: efflux RND transporter periplasmic adaptor subunit, partial [Pseudomonadota bacterium]
AEKELDRLEIRAPFAGLLETDTAELGTLLQPGTLCGTLIALDPIELVGFVPELDVERVTLGAEARARLSSGREVTGSVRFVARSSDPLTRTFRVEIEVPNPDNAIRDGLSAEIVIALEGSSGHLIPQSALTLDDSGTLGVRLHVDGVARFNPVSVIRDDREGIWLGGLPETPDVIVIGQDFVTDGRAITPVYQDLSP